jgi:thiol-disulfide isomerase/thioredoxin
MTKLLYLISATAIICSVALVASGAGEEGAMPDLNSATTWLNSSRLSSKELRGKVVLVNFWTYSCINSLRELPYMKAWAAKYKDAASPADCVPLKLACAPPERHLVECPVSRESPEALA